ncbi:MULTISPECIES: hypothetical protein [Streptomyces]|uniref:hypothetical protein n=1 Tax=Streptomyces TaxID=1883 RepID=UPI000C27F084|nr:hypothetical protein [Streptomyces sp. CB02120-2]PJN19281.1 hypothetical protein CG724_11055 [Streptomyces sp. CB02120-2]
MSDEQQPRPDEQGTAGHYERADASKFPTSELGQRAAVEGTAAAQGWTGPGLTKAVRDHNRRAAARSKLEINPPQADVLREKVLALFAEMEEATEVRRAGHEAAHGLRQIADRYAKAESYEERDAVAQQAGGSLNLPEAGLVRRLAKALERTLPDLIVDAHVDGMNAPAIARELACTDRHAYQVIRDRPWEAHWALYRAMWSPRMDYEWRKVASGTVETTETAEDLASQILDERLDNTLAREGARVCVWRTGDVYDMDDARGIATHQPHEAEFPQIDD